MAAGEVTGVSSTEGTAALSLHAEAAVRLCSAQVQQFQGQHLHGLRLHGPRPDWPHGPPQPQAPCPRGGSPHTTGPVTALTTLCRSVDDEVARMPYGLMTSHHCRSYTGAHCSNAGQLSTLAGQGWHAVVADCCVRLKCSVKQLSCTASRQVSSAWLQGWWTVVVQQALRVGCVHADEVLHEAADAGAGALPHTQRAAPRPQGGQPADQQQGPAEAGRLRPGAHLPRPRGWQDDQPRHHPLVPVGLSRIRLLSLPAHHTDNTPPCSRSIMSGEQAAGGKESGLVCLLAVGQPL